MKTRRKMAVAGLLSLGAALSWCAGPAAAQAEAWPAHAVKILVPLAPGGSTDLIARAVGNELSKVWGDGHATVLSLMAASMLASLASRLMTRPLYETLAEHMVHSLPPKV